MTTLSPLARAAAGAALALGLAVGAPALAADQVTFQLDWVPGGDKAHVYVGVQQGFFAEEGIELEILSGSGSTDAITRIATGASDIGVCGLGALMAAKVESPELPVTAVMSVFTDGPHAIFTTADTSIDALTDVGGTTVGTAPFSSSNVYWPLVLSENGVDPESVEIVNTEPGSLGPMLMTGRIDAAIMWVTNEPLLEPQAAEAGKELVMMPWSDYGLEMYSTSLVVSDSFIEENPDLLRRFNRAFAKSMAFMRDNPAVAAEALATIVPEIDAAVAEGQIRAALDLAFNDATEAAGPGNFDPDRLAGTWDWVSRAQGFAPDAIDPESVVDRSFVPAEAM
ncbi:MAG: ABC transporter substrate-binding protein [Azospirillaceae bacterium]